MLDWPLLSGAVPIVLRVAAGIAGVGLICCVLVARRRLWVRISELVVCLVIAAGATALLDHMARTVWLLFPDRLQPAIYGWVGAGLFAVILAIVRAVTRGVLRQGTIALSAAGLVVLAAGANQVNAIYGTYLTPRDLFGIAHA